MPGSIGLRCQLGRLLLVLAFRNRLAAGRHLVQGSCNRLTFDLRGHRVGESGHSHARAVAHLGRPDQHSVRCSRANAFHVRQPERLPKPDRQ
ncbi:hypothetical protein [Streptomyces coerulescens]|uniref:Secreted protein n=1 Tax=Streptomyces coerulescens TaxID=29304 RepID=A0ABW0CXR8_STRCD